MYLSWVQGRCRCSAGAPPSPCACGPDRSPLGPPLPSAVSPTVHKHTHTDPPPTTPHTHTDAHTHTETHTDTHTRQAHTDMFAFVYIQTKPTDTHISIPTMFI